MEKLNSTLLSQNIEKIAEYDFQNNKVFGSAYLVMQENEVVYNNCFGTTFVPTKEQWGRIIDMHNRVDGKNISLEMPENCIFFDTPYTHYLGGAGLV